MELYVCPICDGKGLMKSEIKGFSKQRIVCENEYFQHVRIGMVDLLIHTEKSKRDEDEEAQLVPA